MTQHTSLHSRRFTLGFAGTIAASLALATVGRALAAPSLTAFTTSATAPAATDNPALRWHPEIFVQDNLDLADQIVAPDFAWHAPGIPTGPIGPAGVKMLATAYRTAFGNLQLTDEDPVMQGDRTVYRFTLTGIHQADLLGIPATGKQISVTGFDMIRVADGKIAELWQVWDRMGFLEQVNASIVPA